MIRLIVMPDAPTPLLEIHHRLRSHFGPLHWWPAESPFEVVVGAILTQNTNWQNVEKAIANLRQAGALSAAALAEMDRARLEELIRPSGFFRQKAQRLQALARHLRDHWQGDIESCCSGPLEDVRERLLARPGVGPETADSILLYAAGRASFVVDAYTLRIFARIGILSGGEGYLPVRALFMQQLPDDAALYNEYHAQIVQLAKSFCRKNRPLCAECPLNGLCRHAASREKTGPG